MRTFLITECRGFGISGLDNVVQVLKCKSSLKDAESKEVQNLDQVPRPGVTNAFVPPRPLVLTFFTEKCKTEN